VSRKRPLKSGTKIKIQILELICYFPSYDFRDKYKVSEQAISGTVMLTSVTAVHVMKTYEELEIFLIHS
jgi:hypothetical protein